MRPPSPPPGPWLLFRIWATVGFQSFGGGSSAQFLIQRAFIEQHGWLTAEEYLHLWGLCILTPGINMIALTVLIGRKLSGVRGIVASLAGLLLPSATITCFLAAIFQHIAGVAAVGAVLRGIVPATGGVMLLVGSNFARPLLRRAREEGVFALVASCGLILACTLFVILLKFSVIAVIVGAIGLGALLFTRRPAPPIVEEKRTVQS
jgi:chromate transporter